MGNKLSKSAMHDLNYILTDEEFVSEHLLIDGERAMYRKINEDGSITLGKTKCNWFNRLIKDVVEISFNDLAIRIVKAIIKRNKGNPVLVNGLSLDAANELLLKDDKESLVELLMVNYRYAHRTLKGQESSLANEDIRRQPNIKGVAIEDNDTFMVVPIEKIKNKIITRRW